MAEGYKWLLEVLGETDRETLESIFDTFGGFVYF